MLDLSASHNFLVGYEWESYDIGQKALVLLKVSTAKLQVLIPDGQEWIVLRGNYSVPPDKVGILRAWEASIYCSNSCEDQTMSCNLSYINR